MYAFLRQFSLFTLLTLPVGIATLPLVLVQTNWAQILATLSLPLLYIGSFALVAIAWARLGLKGLKAGCFERRLEDPVYGPRVLHSTMWTALFYFKPLYWILLSQDWSKTLLLRGFGYRGSTQVTLYPDTWLRDLPLLNFKDGAYIGNRATLGSNIVRLDGRTIVESIEVGERSIVGHLAVLAPGVSIGDETEIGACAVLGIKTRIGNRCQIGSSVHIDHGCLIGDEIIIKGRASIGKGSQIVCPGLVIPRDAQIPERSRIHAPGDLEIILRTADAYR